MKNTPEEEFDGEEGKKDIDIMEKLHKKKMAIIEKCF